MAKYIVNCKDSTVQLGCKLGQFNFKKGDIIENDLLAMTFPNMFIRLTETPPEISTPVIEKITPAEIKVESVLKVRENLIPPPVETIVTVEETPVTEVTVDTIVEETVVTKKVSDTQTNKKPYKKSIKK